MNSVSLLSLSACLRKAAVRLSGPDARHEAEILLLHVLGRDRAWLFMHGDDAMPDSMAADFEALLARREAGEPVAYLVGTRGFWTLDLQVTPDTLIPRPETELLVEQALERLPSGQPVKILDLGTGSGAIALAIASERPLAQVIATDADPDTLAVAAGNARRNRVDNVGFRCASWYSVVEEGGFDVIVSNPPYIAEGDPHLTQGDLRFEPPAALSSGADGLDAIREIVAGAPTHLVSGGWLLLEHGFDQGLSVRRLMQEQGFGNVVTVPDLEQRDRVTLGQYPSE